MGGTLDQVVELVSQSRQLGDGPLQLVGPSAQEPEHMAARRLTIFAEGDDAADLTERQAHRLGGADEAQAVEDQPS